MDTYYRDEHFTYDPATGKLWHARSKGLSIKAGDRVTTAPANNGHLYTSINGKKYLQHTVVYKLVKGRFPAGVIRHKDGDLTNLKWDNLEHISRSRLAKRYTKRGYVASSKHRGVYYKKDRKKYIARISVDGISRSLGSYANINDAIRARKKAEKKYGYVQ